MKTYEQCKSYAFGAIFSLSVLQSMVEDRNIQKYIIFAVMLICAAFIVIELTVLASDKDLKELNNSISKPKLWDEEL